ncbi:CML25 [Symbiodinium necroappetens]|uniref:CML25 protein n=1 Tax=Symbiodinium necroappetens TaxID=1628268 RepID=A0A812Z1H1_9DINO|nr:CML25 [Symbiodinium necroappetens]
MADEAVEKTWSSKTKEIFQKWDVHNTGVITRKRLQGLLSQVAGKAVTEEEIERCISEADKNNNGLIEYNEFIEWLQQPCATVRMGSQGLEYFSLEAAVRPLYDVYDQNGDGLVSMEEFVQCQTILQNCLGLRSETAAPLEDQFKKQLGKESGSASLSVFDNSPKRAFGHVDADNSKGITFEEFLDWQRKQLVAARTPSKELEELLPALARQLKRVFKFDEQGEKDGREECDSRVLQKIVDNLAKMCMEIWSKKAEEETKAKDIKTFMGKARHYTNRWTEPPVGLNVKKLKAKFLATESCTRVTENMDLDLMVIPVLAEGDDVNPRSRIWLAQIIQKVTMKDGKVREDDPVYYEFESLSWHKTDEAMEKFHTALDALPPELRMFSLLKAEADFGTKITWEQVEKVLNRCLGHGVLTATQISEYTSSMELRVTKALKDEDLLSGMSAEESKKKIRDSLLAVSQRPQDIMAMLSDLKIFKVSSVWADFMTAD